MRPIDGRRVLRDHRHMEATFPSRAVTRGVAVAGALGLLGAIAVFVIDFRDHLAAIVWFAPFVGAYAAGLIAFRLQPDQLAARRLLVFGTLATIWIAATVGLVVAYEAQGNKWWLGPANVAVHVVGLAMEAAMIALLAIYPDGRHHRSYERRTVQIAAALSLAVPVVLLISYETVQPSWGFSWGAEGATPFPTIASPLHVGALGFLGPPARVLLEGALMFGPVIGTTLVALRYRRLPRRQEMQVRWPMYGVFVLLLLPLAQSGPCPHQPDHRSPRDRGHRRRHRIRVQRCHHHRPAGADRPDGVTRRERVDRLRSRTGHQTRSPTTDRRLRCHVTCRCGS